MRSVPRSVLAAYAAMLGLVALLAFALRRAPTSPPATAPPAHSYRRVHIAALPPPLAALTASVFGSARPASPWVRAQDVFFDASAHEGFLVVDDGIHAPAAVDLAGLASEALVTLDEASPLRITVRDDEGHPIVDAAVRALDLPWSAALPTLSTDASGLALIPRPPREAFRVAITSPGHVPRVVDSTVLAGEAITLERAVTRSFEVRDERDAPLADARVWVASSGVFEPIEGSLTASGTILLTLPRKTPAPVHVETATSCSAPGLALHGEGPGPARVLLREGWFQRVSVRARDGSPLRARLRFGDPDEGCWRPETSTDDAGEALLGPLCSPAVAITADVGEATTSLVLRRGEAAQASMVVERPARLRVTVTDEEGKPAPQVRVALALADDDDDPKRSDDPPSLILGHGYVPMGELGITRGPVATLAELERDGFRQGAVGHPSTSADGVVTLTRLPPVRVTITLRRTGFVPATLGPIELVAGEETLVRGNLTRAAHLEGTVLDERGFPQRAYVVRLADTTGNTTEHVTARDGRFSFDDARGDVLLSVSKGGGDELERVALHLEPGTNTSHDVVVRGAQSRKYRVRTVDSRGYPIEGASVALRPPGGLVRLADARTARDGTASIAFPTGASLEVSARAAGFVPAVVLLDGESAETVVTLEGSEARSVRVVDDRRGSPIAGAVVWLRAAYGDSVTALARTTDRFGSVHIEAPRRATIEVVVSAPDYGATRSLVAAGAREHTIRLAPAVTFEGRVIVGDMPVEGATVALETLGRVEPGVATARTDREGRFRFAHAALGTRTLEVCAAGLRCRRISGLRGDDRRPVDLGPIALERAGGAGGGDVALDVRPSGAGLVVEAIFPASKAAESGVRTGDVIVLVDGQPAEAARLPGQAGSTIVLTVERGGARSRVALVRERVLR